MSKKETIFASFSTSSNYLWWWQQNFYLLPAESRRSWVVRALPFLKNLFTEQLERLRWPGWIPAVPKVAACSGRPGMTAGQQCLQRVGVAQVGAQILCALEGSLTRVSSAAALLDHRPKPFRGFTSCAIRAGPWLVMRLCEGSSGAFPCTPCPGTAFKPWPLPVWAALPGPVPHWSWRDFPHAQGLPHSCSLGWCLADTGWSFQHYGTCSTVLAWTWLPLPLLRDTFGLEKCIYL